MAANFHSDSIFAASASALRRVKHQICCCNYRCERVSLSKNVNTSTGPDLVSNDRNLAANSLQLSLKRFGQSSDSCRLVAAFECLSAFTIHCNHNLLQNISWIDIRKYSLLTIVQSILLASILWIWERVLWARHRRETLTAVVWSWYSPYTLCFPSI